MKPLLKLNLPRPQKFRESDAHQVMFGLKPTIANHPRNVSRELIGQFDIQRFHRPKRSSFVPKSNPNFPTS
ncbi:MAG: hypothetical protein ABIY47_08785 [Opitutaceae bacterium]